MNRLVLLDGNALLHRAYHALPPLTAPDGLVVNAIYGFTSMLLRVYNDFHPTHMAVAFDRPEPTFRKELLATYQAQRPEMEDTLVSQIDPLKNLLNAFGIPIYEKAGLEADDVIGTIAKNCLTDEVIVVTGDRDILQLVDKKIKVFMPVKGLSEGKLFGEAEVMEKMGVKPSQIPELKGLMGDPSDNYFGVPGIGPKTAAHLITKFGTVKKIYQALDKNKLKDFSESIVIKLKEGRESASVSYQLATIKTDAPLAFDLNKSKLASLDTNEARKNLKNLGFKSLLARLTGEKEAPKKPEIKKEKKKNDQQGLF